MNIEKELKKITFEPLCSTTFEEDCAIRTVSNGLEHWVEGGKPCPKCGSFHTQKNIAMCLTTYPCQYHFRCTACSHTWTAHEWYDGGLSYQPKPENINPYKEYGWICPKCGRVYSPHMDWCTHCNGTYSPNLVYCGSTSINDVLDTDKISTTLGDANNTIKGVCTNGNKSNI